MIERHIIELNQAIDRAVLDPAQWSGVLDTIYRTFPGTKVTIHLADKRNQSSIGVTHVGFDPAHIATYEQHFAQLNPWMPYMVREAPPLRALVSEKLFPASSFRETEFYRDWLEPAGEIECTVGLKLVSELDRIGVMAVHYGSRQAGRYDDEVARVLQSCSTRMRRAVDVLRLARKTSVTDPSAPPSPVPIHAFIQPAFLLDGHGRVLNLNGPAQQLTEGRTLSLGLRHALRLADTSASEQVAAAIRQIAAGHGPLSQGRDLALATADGRRLSLSLVPVQEPPMPGVPAFFAPSRLILLLVRTDTGSDGLNLLERRYKLTPAERRLVVQLLSGRPLRECAEHLGIVYGTARSQLKSVFSKTGVSRQHELVALLSRLFDS